jgi:DNA polymerase-3 subunit gamma/tau
MSYLVLARKWRPLQFDDVVGQQHITTTLQKAIEKDRVAHSYIFSGIRGVGKTTVARIFARALNCDKGPTPTPCGECAHCTGILTGAGFDVREIDGASHNSVEDIRQLRENVTYSSMDSRYKIIIIDEVHMLTKSAFNALLKTLEEPPPGVIFIFATTEPHKIPETIHSRCQRYDFRRISTERIVGQLQHICEQEEVPFEKKALLLIAQKAAGSMRDGLSLLDQVYSFCTDAISDAQVRSVLGMVSSEIYERIITACIERTPETILHSVQSVLYEGHDIAEFVSGLQQHLRLLLFATLPGIISDTRIELNIESPEKREALTRQARHFDEKTLLRMIEVTKQVEREITWSAFPRFVVEMGLLKMAYMDTSLSVEEILTALREAPPLPAARGDHDASASSQEAPGRAGPAPQRHAPDGQSAASSAPPETTPEGEKKKEAAFSFTPEQKPVTGDDSAASQADAAYKHPEQPAASQQPAETTDTSTHALPGRVHPASGNTLPSASADSSRTASTTTLSQEAPPDKEGTGEHDNAASQPHDAQRTAGPEADVRNNWDAFIEYLTHERPTLGSALSFAQVISASDTAVDLRFTREFSFQYKQVTFRKNRNAISELAAAFFARSLHIHINYDENEHAAQQTHTKTAAARNSPHASLDRDRQQEPIIQTILDTFDADIIA